MKGFSQPVRVAELIGVVRAAKESGVGSRRRGEEGIPL